MTEDWKSYSAAKPSKLHTISTRIGGVMCILAGIAGIIIQFVS